MESPAQKQRLLSPSSRTGFPRRKLRGLWGQSSVSSAMITVAPEINQFHSFQLSTRLFQPDRELAFTTAYSGAAGDTFDAYTFSSRLEGALEFSDWKEWSLSLIHI